jgi:hypothetical protein
MSKKNPNLFLVRNPSKNLNMARTNLEDEKLVKKQWSLKRLKLWSRERKPSQHEHTPLLTLWLNFDKSNGAPNGKRRMGLPKEGHHLNKGGLKVK